MCWSILQILHRIRDVFLVPLADCIVFHVHVALHDSLLSEVKCRQLYCYKRHVQITLFKCEVRTIEICLQNIFILHFMSRS